MSLPIAGQRLEAGQIEELLEWLRKPDGGMKILEELNVSMKAHVKRFRKLLTEMSVVLEKSNEVVIVDSRVPIEVIGKGEIIRLKSLDNVADGTWSNTFTQFNRHVLKPAAVAIFGEYSKQYLPEVGSDGSEGRRVLKWTSVVSTVSGQAAEAGTKTQRGPRLAVIRWKWHSAFMSEFIQGVDEVALAHRAEMVDIRMGGGNLIVAKKGESPRFIRVMELPETNESGSVRNYRAGMLKAAVKVAHNKDTWKVRNDVEEGDKPRLIISRAAELNGTDLSHWAAKGYRIVLSGGHPSQAEEIAICIRPNDGDVGRKIAEYIRHELGDRPPNAGEVLVIKLEATSDGSPARQRWTGFIHKYVDEEWGERVTLKRVIAKPDRSEGDYEEGAAEKVKQLLAEMGSTFAYRYVVTLVGEMAIGVERVLAEHENENLNTKIVTAGLHNDILDKLQLERSRIEVACGVDRRHQGRVAAEWALSTDPYPELKLLPPLLLTRKDVKDNILTCATELVNRYPEQRFHESLPDSAKLSHKKPKRKKSGS